MQGFFSETLPHRDMKKLCIIRLDGECAGVVSVAGLKVVAGDTWESTMTAIAPLYPLLSDGEWASARPLTVCLSRVVGGFVIVDDYHFGACRLAIDTYRAEHGITAPLRRIDAMSVFWVKGEPSESCGSAVHQGWSSSRRR